MTTIKAYFENNRHLGTLVSAFLVIVTVFFVAKTVNEVKQYETIGGMPTSNMISVTGKGEVSSVPNLAQVSFGVESEAMSVATAQAEVTKRITDLTAYLTSQGVEAKDVKTTGYNIYPRYEYVRSAAVSCLAGNPCYYPEGQQVLKGYVVSHMMDVKIRKTEDAGKILSGLGERKVTNLSGLNFTVEDEEASKDAAREEAIADAKDKAEKLAKQLGVKLVKIVSYNENGDYPYYYAKSMYAESSVANVGMGGDIDVGIQAGENTITSNVTITYEIR